MLSLPDFKEKNIVVCFAAEGQRISFKNDNLLIKDAEEQVVLQVTCHKVFSLWIVGNFTITSGVLEKSKKFAFSIYLLSFSHKPYGLWNSATEGNFLLRRKQYDYNDTGIAKYLISNKIQNQIGLLKSVRNKEDELKLTIEKLYTYKEQIPGLENLNDLLGIEGISSRLYFGKWFAGMHWEGRKPRSKIDFINTTMDIGYTYLFNIVECMLNLYGFDLYQGVYHKCFYQRKSLVCDIVEPFRCIIDKQIKKAYGLNQLKEEDFREDKGQYFLKPDKNKDYTRWLIQSILENKEEMFTYTQEYYRCFMRNKPIAEYPVFTLTT